MKSPTHNDWVSQVLKDLEETNFEIDFEEIGNTSKDKVKDMLLGHVQAYYFSQLLRKKESRTSENAKGRNINYPDHVMQNSLNKTNIDPSLDEKKCIFKCRTYDLDIQGNFQWKYKTNLCISCKLYIFEIMNIYLLVQSC